MNGISTIDPKKYPHEYYKLTAISKATGLSLTHLRKSPIPKYRFGNAVFLKVAQVNEHIENSCLVLDEAAVAFSRV